MKRTTLIVASAFAVAGAQAQIVTTLGGSEIAAPASVQLNVLEGTEGYVFTEREFVSVIDLAVDHDGSAGIFQTNSDLSPTSLTGTFSSYFMHMDAPGGGLQSYDFSVTFAQAIQGVVVKDATLDATDAVLGNPGTAYPNGLTNRGWETSTDDFAISINGNTLRFTGRVTTPLDSVRVLTNPVPEPTTIAALGLGALALLRRKRSK
ncbi:MAG: PEP-CTERM sorting domain-containing protein [Fimbriimonadaceae bacterium]